MADRDEMARLRNEEHQLEFAVRKSQREMDAVERALERRLREFEHDEAVTKRELEAELRREHGGREPERPLRWLRAS